MPFCCVLNLFTAPFLVLNVLQDAVLFQTAISAEPVFSLNAIYPLDQSEFVRCNPTWRRFEAFVCAQSSK